MKKLKDKHIFGGVLAAVLLGGLIPYFGIGYMHYRDIRKHHPELIDKTSIFSIFNPSGEEAAMCDNYKQRAIKADTNGNGYLEVNELLPYLAEEGFYLRNGELFLPSNPKECYLRNTVNEISDSETREVIRNIIKGLNSKTIDSVLSDEEVKRKMDSDKDGIVSPEEKLRFRLGDNGVTVESMSKFSSHLPYLSK